MRCEEDEVQNGGGQIGNRLQVTGDREQVRTTTALPQSLMRRKGYQQLDAEQPAKRAAITVVHRASTVEKSGQAPVGAAYFV